MGGKLVGNRDNQAGISFPASATSYRDLRLGAGGGGGGGGNQCNAGGGGGGGGSLPCAEGSAAPYGRRGSSGV